MTLNRYKAFGIHLLGSLVVALLTAALVFLVWYPGLLAGVTGVTGIFLIVLGVDVTIGPLITLIVFNPAKKELRRDLMIVLLLQLSALAYGLHTVWVARPVYQIYNAGRFDLVLANELDEEHLSKATRPEFRSLPVLGPQTIGAQSPSDTKARNEVLFSSVAGGDDLPQMPQYYLPYADMKASVVSRLKPLDKLLLNNAAKKEQVEALQARYAKRAVGYVPLKGRAQDLTVIIDSTTGEILEYVPLDPW